MDNHNEGMHSKLEGKSFWFIVWTTIAILIGGLVEIPPFFMQGAVEPIEAVTPYNALELAGRNVYQAEGCFNCHTQMIRPFKWETDRWDRNREYGSEPYSKAGEYVYEHPFLFGSKRTGPDLSHEASLNNNVDWQIKHLINPQDLVPGSIMPGYPWLFAKAVNIKDTQDSMRALSKLGIPYSYEEIEEANTLLEGKTKGDALVAYLLKLGKDMKQTVGE